MALAKKKKVKSGDLYIWKITEELEELYENLLLSSASLNRLKGLKSLNHKKAFLAVRQVLKSIGIDDIDLFYDSNGKPFLSDDRAISISHSFDYAVVYISTENIGVDIELKRDKIVRLASKFCSVSELTNQSIEEVDRIDYLTEIWSAKEAVYKMCNSRSLSFVQQINVDVVNKTIVVEGEDSVFGYELLLIEDFIIVCSYLK